MSKPFRIPDLIPKIDELVEKNKLQPLTGDVREEKKGSNEKTA